MRNDFGAFDSPWRARTLSGFVGCLEHLRSTPSFNRLFRECGKIFRMNDTQGEVVGGVAYFGGFHGVLWLTLKKAIEV